MRHDEVGYVRAEVPVDRADVVAESAGVEAAAVDFAPTALPAMLAGPRELPSDPDASAESMQPPDTAGPSLGGAGRQPSNHRDHQSGPTRRSRSRIRP